jgi:hypothetical protein
MTLKRHDAKLIHKHIDGLATHSENVELDQRARADVNVRHHLEASRQLIAGLASLPDAPPDADLVAAAERRFSTARKSHEGQYSPLMGARAVIVAALVVFVVVRDEETAAESAPRRFVASAVVGNVWMIEGSARRAVAVGAEIGSGALLESDVNSQLRLSHGPGADITVQEGSTVRIGHDRKSELELRHGVLYADVSSTVVQLDVRFQGLSQVVRVTEGAAGVLSDGRTVTVSCVSGTAKVIEGGREVEVEKGFAVSATAAGIGTLRPAEAELVLVLEPVGQLSRGVSEVEVVGRTAQGVLLTIDGVGVEVGADGTFRHRVAYDGTTKRVTVRVRDALDRWREARLALAPAKQPRKFEPIQTDWEWEEPPKTPG